MIRPEQLKKGNFVWWKKEDLAERNCPCLIVDVSKKEKTFRLKLLDGFRETKDIAFDHPSLSEMELCDASKAKDYLSGINSELKILAEHARDRATECTSNFNIHSRRMMETLETAGLC